MPKDSPELPLRVIDLFAGCGGFTLGFVGLNRIYGRRLFEVVWANDFDSAAAATYNRNFGDHCTHGDIVDLLEDPSTEIPQADIVIGGPPCQGFSLLNKNRDGDPRKELWRPFMEVVKRSGATSFVMENVQQLLTSEEYEDIARAAVELGFQQPIAQKLCAADYGVPQERYRAIVFAVKKGDPQFIFPPPRTHYNDRDAQINAFYRQGRNPWNTVRHAIEDLPEPTGTEIREAEPPLDLHFGRNPTAKSRRRYRAIPDEGMNRFDLQERAPELTPACWIRKKSGGTDLFGRLWWDRPSVTIRTEFFKPEKGRYLHPVQHRPITHREAARLQSFPDDFVFEGSKIEIARQIGNAVPPLLGMAVARSVARHYNVDVRAIPAPTYLDWIASRIRENSSNGRQYDRGAAEPHHVQSTGKEHDPRTEGAEYAPSDGLSLQTA